MDLQERYDELYNMIDRLDSIIYDLDNKYMNNYIVQLLETKLEAEKELQQIEPELQKIQWQEEQAQENEYWRAVI